jgi:competence protein ComEC
MKPYPIHRPFAAAIAAFICGIWLSRQWTASFAVWLGLGLAAVGFVCAALYVRRAATVFLCLAALTAGFLFVQPTEYINHLPLALAGQEIRAEVRLTAAPAGKTYVDGRLVGVDGKAQDPAPRIRISRPYGDETVYKPGAVYRVSGKLRAPLGATNPGGWNEAATLGARGIYTVLEADQALRQTAPAPAWAARIAAMKDRALALFSQYLDAGETALVFATLFGDVSGLNDDFYNLSQQFGIIHIFSVSGLHVAFILAFLLGLARLLRRQNSPILPALLLPLLALYTLMSDCSAPAVRASLMAMLALFALRLRRYRDPITITAEAALCLVLADPYNLWLIGFQLSFAAMLAIFILAPRIETVLAPRLGRLSGALAVSLAAEAVSLPLSAYYFYMVSPLSVVMNLLVVPLFSVLVPLALLALLAALLLPQAGLLLFFPVKVLIYTVTAVMAITDAWVGNLHFYIGQPPVALIALYLAALLVFCRAVDSRRLRLPALAAAVGLLLCICFRPAVDTDLRLTVLDVGQGSSALYQTADGAWLVLDTGPAADTPARTLRYYGVNHVSAIVLSHSDSDHITGCAHLLRDFHVSQLLATQAAQASSAWQALEPYLDDTQVITVDQDERFQLGTTSLEAALVNKDSAGEENTNQLVCRIDDAPSVLAPGDTDGDHLTQIPFSGGADIILAPHHGSRYSWREDFYRRCKPAAVAISAGRDNRFGHPHTEVTQGLEKMGIPFYRTDQSGAMLFYQTEAGTAIKPFLG